MPAVAHYPPREGRDLLAKRKINSNLAHQLRKAIRDSGLSLYELGQRCGVAPAVLSRFMQNKRTVTLPIASKICDELGLELSPKKPKKGKDEK